MTQEIAEKKTSINELIEIYDKKIAVNEYTNAVFNFCACSKEWKSLIKLYKIIRKRLTEPGVKELKDYGLIKLENHLIKPTDLGLSIYKLVKKKSL